MTPVTSPSGSASTRPLLRCGTPVTVHGAGAVEVDGRRQELTAEPLIDRVLDSRFEGGSSLVASDVLRITDMAAPCVV
jgi:hypothetical protein